jgi:hypothetical protein
VLLLIKKLNKKSAKREKKKREKNTRRKKKNFPKSNQKGCGCWLYRPSLNGQLAPLFFLNYSNGVFTLKQNIFQ